MSQLAYEYMERTVLAVGQPAAGAGVTVPVPQSEQQQLVAVTMRLVTSAVVANRTPVVTITGGDGVAVGIAVAGFALTAGSTADFAFVAGLKEWDSAGGSLASGPCPELPLVAGDSVVISVNGIDAADQLSRIRVAIVQTPIRDDDR